jgi:putative FmdB family regulatory protein
MPLYEYECQQCHRRLEKIQSFSAPPETVCPHCGGALEKTLSAPAVQFKGAGWYVNDYASKSKSGAKKDSGGSADVSASADSSSSSDKTSSDSSAAPNEKPSSAAPASESKSGSSAKTE